ncbi:Echinoderm microtubule-associated protein-like 1 [Liparis tanakae]|uniref:Echinoderm microtubule-associated protein-like 1 n=1 Tax=Liparis tanakae TaxID=230148 RepID=A0A4Z2J207_9TELE|nr:Echinoderm microtubule-associated protein-like 1 [Liparis tanakae]
MEDGFSSYSSLYDTSSLLQFCNASLAFSIQALIDDGTCGGIRINALLTLPTTVSGEEEMKVVTLLIFAAERAEEDKWLRACVHAPVFIIDGKEVSK